MTVNLSPFLNQNVIVTFRSGQVHEGRLEANPNGSPVYPYWLETETDTWSFLENGRYRRDNVTNFDIIEIRLARDIPPSDNAIEKVAMALLPEIAAALQQDEYFQNLLRQKIERKLDKIMEGGLVDKTFAQVAEVLTQNIVVTTKAQ